MIYVFILLFLSFYSYYMDTPHITPWRNTFEQINNPQWEHYAETQKMWSQMQHNPCITLTKKDHSSLVHGDGPALIVHGFGSSKDVLPVYIEE